MSKKITNEETEDNNDTLDKLDEFINEEHLDEDLDEELDEDEDEHIYEENDVEGDECAVEKAMEDEIDILDNIYNSEILSKHDEIIVENTKRISPSRLTKYELTRMIGERTKQLTEGAKPLVKNYKGLSYNIIAKQEFLNNMLPFKIKRPLPNGTFEIWDPEELFKNHLLNLIEDDD
jgi:DNA-directed RNA polymerase subunit K/omega